MQRATQTAIFAIAWLGFAFGSLGNSASFSFTVATDAKTSAGVFDENDKLLRTLWSNVSYTAGQHSATWDGFDDDGQSLNPDTLSVKVISHNVSYNWDGVLGNTSEHMTGVNKMKGAEMPSDIVFDQNGIGYATIGSNEMQYLLYKFEDSRPRVWYKGVRTDYQRSLRQLTIDDTRVYAGNTGTGFDWENFLYRYGINTDLDSFLTEKGFPTNENRGANWSGVVPHPQSITGMAVEKSGNTLYTSQALGDTIFYFDKTTGDSLGSFSIPHPRQMEFDLNGNLWIINGTPGQLNVSKYAGFPNNPQLLFSITGLENGLDLSISPDGSTIAVADGGASQQVKGFSTVDGSLQWTLGIYGGQFANGPDIENKKFFFRNFTSKPWSERGLVAYAPSGNIYVGDIGNQRVQIFDTNHNYVDTQQYIPVNYVAAADYKDPSRAYIGWLEFEVDYSKPLGAGGWKMVKNWSSSLPTEYDGHQKEGISGTITMTFNGVDYTYALVSIDAPHFKQSMALLLLPDSGNAIDTGQRFSPNHSINPDGSMVTYRNGTTAQEIVSTPMTGVTLEGFPIWGTEQTLASVPLGQKDPYFRGFFSSYHGPRFPVTSGGVVVFFDQKRRDSAVNPGFHLGGAKIGNTDWQWRASPSGKWRAYFRAEDVGEIRGDVRQSDMTGIYDDETFHTYGGNRVMAIDQHIVYGYHGEFWKDGQANQWLHFLENGLFVGQFGKPNYPWKTANYAGVAGNAFSPTMVGFGSDLYIYHNDESIHSGLHRWNISGLDTIQTEVIALGSGSAAPNNRTLALTGNLDFGGILVGGSTFSTLTLSNTGNADLTVSSISYPAGFTGNWSGTITPGGSQDVTVTFSPPAAQNYGGSVSISSDMTSGNSSIGISGSGTAQTTRLLTLSGNLDFGTVQVGDSAFRTLTLSNTGNADLTVSSISYPAGFSGNWSGTIIPGGSQDVTISFSPNTAQSYSGSLSISSDMTGGSASASIIGTGDVTLTRILALSGTLDFGNVQFGGTNSSTLILSNTGNSNLTISSISYPSGFSGGWSGTIPPGGSQSVPVTFNPLAAQSYSGTVSISSDMTSGSNFISVSGNGTIAPTRILTLSGNLSFGDIYTGETESRNLSLSNAGNTTLNISSISFPTGFSGAWSGSIPPSGRQDIVVTFSPLEEQSYSGTVSVSSDLTDGNSTTTISGYGTTTPTRVLALSGDLSFAGVQIDSAATRTLTVGNTGNFPLTIASISYPTGFTGSWSGTIAPGSSQNITVTFTPTAEQSYDGSIDISSDLTGGTSSITISGHGLPIPTRILSISGDLTFDDVKLGDSASLTLTLSNFGNSVLSISSITYPVGFTGNWSGSIAQGGSQDITVTFSPNAEQSYIGSININSDMSSGTSSVSISGNGTEPEPSFPDYWPEFSEWITSYSLSASDSLESADPDKDGFTNIIEYIYGRDPTKFETTPPISWNFISPPSSGGNIRFIEQTTHLPRTVEWAFRYNIGDTSKFIRPSTGQSSQPATDADYSVTDYSFDQLDGVTELYAEPIISTP